MMKYTTVLLLPTLLITYFLGAELRINPDPVVVIDGKRSCLERPEGVAFSPDNKYIVVANSSAHSITVHRRTKDGFKHTPTTHIRNIPEINYPHQVAFTADGQYLGVASRENHHFALFRCNLARRGIIEETPCFSMNGEDSSISFPGSCAFSPVDSTLFISNRMGSHGVTFYRYLGNGQYETTPFDKISEDDLFEYGLGAPHGIEMTPSGDKLMIICNKFWKDPNARGKIGLCVMDIHRGEERMETKTTHAKTFDEDFCLHTVAFHPSGKYMGITIECKEWCLYKLNEETGVWDAIQSIPHISQNTREGIKGIGFSPDGSQVAVTVTGKDPKVLIYDCVE